MSMTMVSKVSSEILALSKEGKLLELSVLIDSLSSSRILQLLSLSLLINSSQSLISCTSTIGDNVM